MKSGKPFDEIFIAAEIGPEKSHEVFLNQEDDFRDALLTGWLLLFKEIGRPLELDFVDQQIENTVQHENAHLSKVNGIPNILHNYTLGVVRDLKTNRSLLLPSSQLVGRLSLRQILDFYSAPHDCSYTDKMMDGLREYDPLYKGTDLSSSV